MRYLLAILLPPLAVLLCGRPFQAVLNLLLTLVFWVPGVLHAILIVHDYHENQQAHDMVSALHRLAR